MGVRRSCWVETGVRAAAGWALVQPGRRGLRL